MSHLLTRTFSLQSMKRITTACRGDKFFDLFSVKSPNLRKRSGKEIALKRGVPWQTQHSYRSIMVKMRFQVLNSGPHFFFVGYPMLNNLADASALGLNLAHFAVHDQSNERLFFASGQSFKKGSVAAGRKPSVGSLATTDVSDSELTDTSDIMDSAVPHMKTSTGSVGCPFRMNTPAAKATSVVPHATHVMSMRPRPSALSEFLVHDSLEGFHSAFSVLEAMFVICSKEDGSTPSFEEFGVSVMETLRQRGRLADFLHAVLQREHQLRKGNATLMFREDNVETTLLMAYMREGGKLPTAQLRRFLFLHIADPTYSSSIRMQSCSAFIDPVSRWRNQQAPKV